MSILRTAIWYGESTLDGKLFTEIVEVGGSKLAPIVRKPLTDNTSRQLMLPSALEKLKISLNLIGAF